jgi:DNA polymerase III alpha subunit
VIPLLKRPRPDGAMITAVRLPTCEALGLIKMDFLGLRNLTGPR